MTSSDISVVERLRNENVDQFLTLVRMHLSFVVDINTDEVDCPTDKPKQFRWNFHKKTKNSTTNSSQNNGNISKNCADSTSITEEGILRLNELIDFLSKPENVRQEGIFRRTGSLNRQQELRQLLLTGSNLGLDDGKFTVHDCASVLKGFLAELPQPLLMDQYYQTYCTLAVQYPPNVESSEEKLLTALQLLLLLLAPLHRSFLQRLLTLLRLVADNETSNRMSPDTLATMFTPHLLCPRKLSPSSFHAECVALQPVVSAMIRAGARACAAPAPLATDAAAYLARAHRHPHLDESLADSAARTVFSFVDRARSRAEGARLPTDAALAQLYAHIQALPDSHHKRRLVKHFNRQNGYGTPIQIQRTGKVAGSRSFGDSIKRHIFNKGLLNKTPKKGSGTSINTIEEKTSKGKLQVEVSHKNIVLKNLANKIANSGSTDDEDCDSDASNESTLSEGAISHSRKRSPKFVSEQNLSILDNEETPKTKKRGTRLFRSKILSTSNINKKYQKRAAIRGTPCVSCFDENSSDLSMAEMDVENPAKRDIKHYLTSTPGAERYDDDCSTPYTVHFRRASMSPITKSTQKLSKAMQESIMTPRSRKPLIITSEQRDSLPETQGKDTTEVYQPDDTKSDVYQSLSLKNDSDFVSSDDDIEAMRSSMSYERLSNSANYSASNKGRRSVSVDVSPLRSETTRFVISHERPNLTLDDVTSVRSLTGPFREYLLSRSVLTATPVDLSMLNKSSDDRLSDSLMYCLDGNVPDMTSAGSLASDRPSIIRSPLRNVNRSYTSRKRTATVVSESHMERKKVMTDKENLNEINNQLRETDL